MPPPEARVGRGRVGAEASCGRWPGERPWAKDHEDVQRAITYFAQPVGGGPDGLRRRVAANEPIGSGVTEAACKVIVKQRLCGSGMKWTEPGAAVVLSLRA